jgi:hypothetical protein
MNDPIQTPAPENRRAPDVDPCSVTGAYHVVRGRYGKRRGDKPLWWVFLYHFTKALAALLPYALAAAIFRACGFDFHGGQQ